MERIRTNILANCKHGTYIEAVSWRALPSIVPPPLAITLLVLGTSPWWVSKVGLYPYLMVEIAIWMVFALGFNLLLGGAGLPSFGHGAFFGVGAYAFGLAQLKLGLPWWAALAAAIGAAALAGALVGAFISHRRGIYYALLTIAFGQVFWFVSIKWHSVTGGEDGLLNIKRAPFLASNEALLYFTLAVLAAVALFLWRLMHSPYGRILGAVKQNETRAAFVGHRVWWYKWSAFTISCAIAGVAGALFALAQQSAYPNVMSLHNSGFVVMMVLIGGGLVSFWGPLAGVAFFLLARDLLGAYTDTWLLWYGLLFMAMVLFKPEGIAGLWASGLSAWRARRAPAAVPPLADRKEGAA
jgi:branched-chain amino acid transport system permease protein